MVGSKILNSKHRLDYVATEDGKYSVDGGLDYVSRNTPKKIQTFYLSLYLDDKSTIQDVLDLLICEHRNKFWKDLTVKQIQAERLNILKQREGKKKRTLCNFTMHHAYLHLYVGGYWIVKKS